MSATVIIDNNEYIVSEVYQPLYNLPLLVSIKRSCDDRWNTILQAEAGYNNNNLFKGTIADWGCSFGYFSFKCAEYNIDKDIYAVDVDENNIILCNKLKEINNNKNINFIHGQVSDLPDKVDGNIVLSIIHHIQKLPIIPNEVLDKLKDANTIYFELAHCNEYPSWSNNLIPSEEFLSPFHYLKRTLEIQFKAYTVRLIGVHNTHLGSLRPLFQLKRHIKEEVWYNDEAYTIFDRFKLPYIDFGDFSLSSDGDRAHKKRCKDGIDYAFANKKDKKYFIKFNNNEIARITDYIDGFLLSDIIKFGLLPYYDRQKIKTELTKYNYSNHQDPHPWNFIVNESSDVTAIDYDDEKSSFDEKSLKIYLEVLIQTI